MPGPTYLQINNNYLGMIKHVLPVSYDPLCEYFVASCEVASGKLSETPRTHGTSMGIDGFGIVTYELRHYDYSCCLLAWVTRASINLRLRERGRIWKARRALCTEYVLLLSNRYYYLSSNYVIP